MLTEFVMIGDQATSFDSKFLTQNQVSHVLNTCAHIMPNIFDPLEMNNPKVRAKLDETKQLTSPLIGKIKYMSILDWEEHKVQRLTDINYLNELFCFIEEAVQGFKSCLITSVNNKCASVVVGIVYMMFKFKWNVHKTLEYICSRKTDIEITKTIIKQLQDLENTFLHDLRRKQTHLRTDWTIYSNLSNVDTEEKLAIKDMYRLIQSDNLQKRIRDSSLNRSVDANFFMGNLFLQAEEEAAIINFYLNSLKHKKEDKKKKDAGLGGSRMGGLKSMKELIAETL
jgi:rRNA-processing protein FCF1